MTKKIRQFFPTKIPKGMPYLWAILLVVWLVANSSLKIDVIATGTIITFVLSYISSSNNRIWEAINWTPRSIYYFLAYTVTLFIEMVYANINMMRYVYSPRINIKPGIVKVRTKLKSPIGRLALANSIALTPGSLVVDLKDDTLFIHWLDVKTLDTSKATKEIVTPFENHLEKVFG